MAIVVKSNNSGKYVRVCYVGERKEFGEDTYDY